MDRLEWNYEFLNPEINNYFCYSWDLKVSMDGGVWQQITTDSLMARSLEHSSVQ
jgi:hypothetical protein